MPAGLSAVCDALITVCIVVLLIAISPLLVVEIALLLLCNVKRLPPLSWMLTEPELEGSFDASVVPPHPEIPEALLKKTGTITMNGTQWYRPFGQTAEAVKTMCELMLAYNTVSTTYGCPDELQGVFWMDGNKVPEKVCCLSYAAWDESNNRYLCNKVNTAVDWAYSDSAMGKLIGWFQQRSVAGMLVFAFTEAVAKEGRIWSCRSMDYSDINWLSCIGKWSMSRLDEPGVNFKRGCYWFYGAFGERLEFGSYTLRKVMHTDGMPVQPAYDAFVKYMELQNTSLIVQAPTVPAPKPGSTDASGLDSASTVSGESWGDMTATDSV